MNHSRTNVRSGSWPVLEQSDWYRPKKQPPLGLFC